MSDFDIEGPPKESSKRPVAVIAVHGVSDPNAGEYAALVADQLRKTGCCSDFVREDVRLMIEPVRTGGHLHKAVAAPGEKTGYGGMKVQQTPPALRRAMQRPAPAAATAETATAETTAAACEEDADRISLETMADQLRDLELPPRERVQETVTYRGRVHIPGGTKPVHVHELYWGDLSRPGPNAVRWFVELYQILFQFVALGRFALDYARAVHPRRSYLTTLAAFHHAGLVLLTIVVPVGNLMLAVLGAGLFAGLLVSGGLIPWACAGVLIGAGILTLKMVVAGFERDLPGIRPWFLAGGLGGTAVFLTFGAGISGWLRGRLLPGEVFDSVQRIALPHGLLDHVRDAGLCWMAVLYLAWGALAVVLLAVTVLQVAQPRLSRDEVENDRVRRSIWTVIVSLVPTSALMLLLTLGVWAAALKVSSAFRKRLSVPEFMDAMGPLLTRGGDVVLITLGAVVMLVIWAGVAFGPGIRAEPRWRKNLPEQKDIAKSRRLGGQLTRGLRSVRTGTEVFRILLLAGWLGGAGWIALTGNSGILGMYNGYALTFMAAFIVVIIIPKGPLKSIATAFRAVLDIVLDVINWLRPYPAGGTPRGRICARYASLLRHLCDPAACGTDYERIVLVVHSQGNMVTSDLFRYLQDRASHGQCEPGLERIFDRNTPPERRIKVYFLSMASPLRQIYSLRFPHQYAWARSEFLSTKPVLLPEAGTLGVHRWTNVFHAGDYVGRHLWTSPDDPASFDPDVPHAGNPAEQEFCLGTGAHLNYFDPDSAAVVAQILQFVRDEQ